MFFPRLRVLTVPDPAQPRTPLDPGFGLGRFSWPEIDNPTPQQAQWNEAVRVQLEHLNGRVLAPESVSETDVTITCTVVAANDKLIALTLAKNEYGYGAAHPNEESMSFLWLPREQRALKAEDIFRSGSGWAQLLARLSHQQLRTSQEAPSLYPKAAKAAAAVVADPANWSLDPDQLQIDFPEYSVAPRLAGMLSTTFPWTQLKPYLAAGFDPADLPRRENP
jgi:hypothetical protein